MASLDGDGPIYVQLARLVEDEILSGTLGPDDPVQSTNAYAAFYRVNPATVAKAFAQLVADGVLYKRRGIGMFVAPDAPAALRRARRARFADEVLAAAVAEARLLGMSAEEVVDRVRVLAAAAEAPEPVPADREPVAATREAP